MRKKEGRKEEEGIQDANKEREKKIIACDADNTKEKRIERKKRRRRKINERIGMRSSRRSEKKKMEKKII